MFFSRLRVVMVWLTLKASAMAVAPVVEMPTFESVNDVKCVLFLMAYTIPYGRVGTRSIDGEIDGSRMGEIFHFIGGAVAR